MVELILVMVIAGILAAVAIPRFMGRSSFDTRGFTDQLASTVRFAQKLAIAQRTPVFVQFTATDATLCYDAGCASFAPGPGGEKPYTVTAPNGLAIVSAIPVLQFDASGGTLYSGSAAGYSGEWGGRLPCAGGTRNRVCP